MTKNQIKTNSLCNELLSITIWVCFGINPMILFAKGEIGFNRSSPFDGRQQKVQWGEILKHKTSKPMGYSMKSSVGSGDLIESADFISSFNKTVNRVKTDKTLGFAGEELKGITTRQLSGAKILYRRCAPGVVLLISLEATSLGSGSVINRRGEIITNWHVIEGQESMMVWFHDPSVSNIQDLDPDNYAIADVIATDPTRDLALLKIRGSRKALSPLKLGKDYQLSIAEDVFAIGHPESYIWSFTYGVISQLRNNYKWVYDGNVNLQADVIQTQTPSNPGNSGGPLFNDKGELIGINSFGSPGSDGLNFAIRVGEIEDFISEARAGKHDPESIVASNNNDSELEWDEFDENENGIIDAMAADTDGDGDYDIMQFDKNEDQITDYYLLDMNGDQDPDVMIVDRDKDGIFEHFLIDADFDGEWDTEGIDNDGDMRPDEFFAYSG